MKIVHLLYSGLGGHGNVFFSLVDADTKKEFTYEALFFGIEDVKSEYINKCEKRNIPWFFSKKKPGLDIKHYRHVYKLLRQIKPDIIFLHGSGYIIPAKAFSIRSKKKIKIIVRETQANHLKTKPQWILLSCSMLLADKIVCLTDEYKQQLKKKLRVLYRRKKVVTIPNGIDMQLYLPSRPNTMRKAIAIGMQSRIVKIKDHLTLLSAFAILKEMNKTGYCLQLRIAGDGDFKEELIKKAIDFGINSDVEFAGVLNESDLIKFLQSLDIYVHASLGETMSTAIMQAMACKLPIVASDVSGINNMIWNGETGLLISPKDPELLAKALYALINDSPKREQLACNALTYAQENFSHFKMFEKYKQVFNN